jgi:hypothetical protein
MEKTFSFVHKHPLQLNGKLIGKCCVCEKINPEIESYICNKPECKEFYFCKNCSEKCSEENLKRIHSHTLKPNKGHFWACDLCRSHVYKNGISLRCIPCDFDICVYCFWNIPNPNTNNNNNDSNRVY